VTLSVSVVLVLGVVVLALCRYAALRRSHALVCLLFGFYLASSPLASAIQDAVSTLADLISGR
jgi:hypothetical protein